ncbi:hypothetical protein [Acidaminococcus intestini]|uniref:hypothetical protein n=1 Tax=Acidaminococcus intestini TaxID=187327 RepID=UPI0027BA1EDD|nr:hypothetical protein [Acidaminococcus intestini]
MVGYDEINSHELPPVNIVLRDSIGSLAVQMLASRYDLSTMSEADALHNLLQIIRGLHEEYHQQGF